MPHITLTLDQDTADMLAARIDDAAPSLEDVAYQALYQVAQQRDENVGYRRRCTCGWLEKFADNPELPVHFDAQTNEYWITDNPARSSLIVRYCFSCGGAAPLSKRHSLFAHVPPTEKSRLAKLCEGIVTFEDAINRLGPPDFDTPGGMMVPSGDESDQEKSIILRTLMYRGLSDTADLLFSQRPNSDGVSLMVWAKPLEDKRKAD
ncbi:hypothetical protein GCM10007874_37260 [Labrys miyagiensis]|uniref:Uncharacterized protein n=2 Tax=Labrys miyagiensis TaxID=346912 RepID=A0ABQ6CKI5_9HYPH|nr:hypothetical protein GCM10007874_37260 [Labrys miyagiensis]